MTRRGKQQAGKKKRRSPDKIDPDRHHAFVLLRYWQGRKDQEQFASEAGIAPSLVSLYDQGKRTVPLPALERSARASDVQTFLLPSLLRALRSFRLAAEGWRRLRRIPADLAFADLLALAGATVEAVLPAGGGETMPQSRPPSAEDREAVPALWVRLEGRGLGAQLALVEEDEEFQTWALCERAAAESIAAAPEGPSKAVDWARLACRIAELCSGEPAFLMRLKGYAAIHLANAWRTVQGVRDAGATFEEGKKLWEGGVSGQPRLLSEAIVLALEANLRRDQRRFAEALERIDDALAADRGDLRSKLLLSKAQILEALGDTATSTAVLEEAVPLADAERDPRTALGVRFQFLVNLCREGRASAAESGLPAVRALAERSARKGDRTRMAWLEGKVAAGVGRLAEAEAAFRQVQGQFRDDRLPYDYALVSLDLALLLLDQGRTAEVRALADEMVWIFSNEGIAREALAALRLFCEAARKETATADLARRLARYLDRACYDPELRFEARANP